MELFYISLYYPVHYFIIEFKIRAGSELTCSIYRYPHKQYDGDQPSHFK